MKLKCLIIDDEPLARKVIREYIEDIDFLELVGQAENPIKAVKLIEELKPTLLLLDIQMPKMSGIDFLKQTAKLPLVILTTAFSEYALEGYELDVIDYLLKPITFDRFLKAASKAKDYHELHLKAEQKSFNYFFIKCDGRLEKIFYDDVFYIEGMSNYIILYTRQKKLVVYMTLKGLKETLPADEFQQIHKSFIVAVSQIDSITANEVMIAGKILHVSRNFKEELMSGIGERISKR